MADEEKDDLRGDIAAAMAELNGGDDGAAGDREPERVEGAAPGGEADRGEGRERDEAGRFKAKEDPSARETLTLKEKPLATTEKPVDVSANAAPSAAAGSPAAPTDGKQPAEPIAPPAEWKGAGKVKWDRLPREVQSELRDTWQALSVERAEMAPLKELFDANREFLINQAGSVVEAQRQMMQFARMTETVDGSIQLAQHILRAKGIDPRAVFAGQPSPGAPQSQPDQTADIAKLVQQQLEPILGQFRQQSLQQEISKIEAFRADPKHPYFNDVAPRIEGYLKAGTAKDLQDAYDQAIWADPTIRQQLMAAQAEEAKKIQAAEVAKAQQASRASLRGSPISGASNGAGNQNSSVLDDVRAAQAELAGA